MPTHSDPDAARRMMLAGLRTQYRAMFHTMATGGRWNVHRGTAGLVLLQDGAPMDVPLPVLVRDVQAMSEVRAIQTCHDAMQRENEAPPVKPATLARALVTEGIDCPHCGETIEPDPDARSDILAALDTYRAAWRALTRAEASTGDVQRARARLLALLGIDHA